MWFNEASMLQTSETGYDTLAEARKASDSGNTNFALDANYVFDPPDILTIPVPKEIQP